jgi:pimeloyl-ACP methyl ester carboxylesterase
VKRHFPFLIMCVMSLLFLSSCTPPTTVPIGTVNFMQSEGDRQHTLLVFLPGIHDSTAAFAEEGFVSAVRANGIKADMIGVEAHVGYYLKKEFLPRLKQDVIDPAKRQGYENIWLVGISLGGFGAIWYDLENPGDLTGIVAFAPYLGEQDVVAEVAQAGGLQAWRPATNVELDDQHRIWRGLKSYEKLERCEGRVYLGYGRQDKFAISDGMLAAVLPQMQVFTIEGGHDWSAWRPLWDTILKSKVLTQSALRNGGFRREGGNTAAFPPQ